MHLMHFYYRLHNDCSMSLVDERKARGVSGKVHCFFLSDCKACYHVYIESMLCMLARIIYLQSKTVLLLQHNAEEIW